MLKYVLDTNIWSMWSKEVEIVVNNIENHAHEGIAITEVTACEAFYGWGVAVRKRPRSEIVRVYRAMMREIEFMRDATVIPFTQKTLMIYEELDEKYSVTDKADLRIAAIAIEHALILVTRNIKDFQQIKELQIADWTVSLHF